MSKMCRVFLVEDREDDALLIRRAISERPTLSLVHHAKNAKEAVSYLQGAGVYAARDRYPMPEVLVLDLEMQNGDGFQVLEWLKQAPCARFIRTVALAAKEHPSYHTRASDLGARCCLEKPVRTESLQEFGEALEDWCRSAPPASSLN